MDLGLTDKRALILASSRGLGLGIATALCEEGAHVLISGRSENRLAEAAARLTAGRPGRASYSVCDLARPDAAQALYRAARQELGGVDILVNNTGGPPPGPAEGPSVTEWREQFDTMVARVFEITNLCLPEMKRAGWGRIVTVTSSSVIQPISNLAMSNTLRAALVGWSKTLSNEVAAAGITVNILAPGRIHTERVDQLDAAKAERLGKTVEEVASSSRASIPAARYGRVEEFGAVAAFLVSEPASYVTGSVIRCDGGSIRSV